MNKNVPSILIKIVETEIKSVNSRKISHPISEIEKAIGNNSKKTLNLAGALWGESVRIIAEIKKSSPTKGLLTSNFSVEKLANTYAFSFAQIDSATISLRWERPDPHQLRSLCIKVEGGSGWRW